MLLCSFIALSSLIVFFSFFLNKCPPRIELSRFRYAPAIRVPESHFAIESESHKGYSGLYGRHIVCSAPAVHSGQLELRKQRYGVRSDKRNFEDQRTRLSVDRRSLRAPDRFDAPPPRVFTFVQTGASPAVNNWWSRMHAHTRSPGTSYFTSVRSIGPATPRKSARSPALIITYTGGRATLIFTSRGQIKRAARNDFTFLRRRDLRFPDFANVIVSGTDRDDASAGAL